MVLFFFCNTTCTFPKRDLSFPRIYHQWKLQCGLMNNFFSKVRAQQYLSPNKILHLWIKREKCFKLFLITKPVATPSHEIITKQQWWNCILKCDKKASWRPSAGHISKIRRPKQPSTSFLFCTLCILTRWCAKIATFIILKHEKISERTCVWGHISLRVVFLPKCCTLLHSGCTADSHCSAKMTENREPQ